MNLIYLSLCAPYWKNQMTNKVWKEYKLGDVCSFQEGYVNPPQNYPEYFNGNIKWLRVTD